MSGYRISGPTTKAELVRMLASFPDEMEVVVSVFHDRDGATDPDDLNIERIKIGGGGEIELHVFLPADEERSQ